MPDRRAGKKAGPHVKTKNGKYAPRSRTMSGKWRKKRSDAKGATKYPK
ncbi:MAG: hypothetical protein ACFFB5_01910 [Promethearchaeota archaeon]